MENWSNRNLEHLVQCKAALHPNIPPQLRLSLANAMTRIREVNKVDVREDACGFCFTVIDVEKANMEIVKTTKTQTQMLKITCHLCKKICKI